jgi:hypothetical protein
LIPQRNISLLSNRLAAGGGLRIREDVLERDYCLAWFLNTLAESDLRPVLVFKSGTALKRCYFTDYRFSEDDSQETGWGSNSNGKNCPPILFPRGIVGTPVRSGSSAFDITPSRKTFITVARRGEGVLFACEPCMVRAW